MDGASVALEYIQQVGPLGSLRDAIVGGVEEVGEAAKDFGVPLGLVIRARLSRAGPGR